ncbi:MAG: hypothetical protein ABFS45_24640, partial [Pseudomonadota bacterium]
PSTQPSPSGEGVCSPKSTALRVVASGDLKVPQYWRFESGGLFSSIFLNHSSLSLLLFSSIVFIFSCFLSLSAVISCIMEPRIPGRRDEATKKTQVFALPGIISS